jgi:osmotically-inducible protein OsmY
MRDENDRDYDTNESYGSISQGRDTNDERYRRNRDQIRRGDNSGAQSPYGDPRYREDFRRDYPRTEHQNWDSARRSTDHLPEREQRGQNYGWYAPSDDQRYGNNYDQRGGQYGRYGSSYGQQSAGGSSDYDRSRAQYGAGQSWQGGYGELTQRGNRDAHGAWERPYHRSGYEGGWTSNRSWLGSRQDGGFAGKGPKGYVRSDERVREDVCDRLSDDDEVDASDITVTVKDGEVTLDGTVETRQAKHRAEDICDSVSGVRDVHNRLRTRRGLIQEVGDRLTGRDEAQQHGHSGSGTRNAPAAGSTG